MLDEDRIALADYRIEKAKRTLAVAKLLFDDGAYLDSVNRSYYSIFHAARALLALEKVEFKKHSAVISHFQRYYIKTKIFADKFSDIIFNAFEVRNESDYEDFYVLSKEDTEQQIKDATEFIDAIEKYINSQKQKLN